jgi:hypothetical protein
VLLCSLSLDFGFPFLCGFGLGHVDDLTVECLAS